MANQLEYAGYIGSADVDFENGVIFGRLLFIRDVIGYSAETVEGLVQAFHEAVDDYLASCEEDGTEPDVPCKGSFNIRVGPECHRKLAIAARNLDVGLNEFVAAALEKAVEPQAPKTVVHNHQWIMVRGEQRTAYTGDKTEMIFGMAATNELRTSDDAAKH